jgi:hypothetical protein
MGSFRVIILNFYRFSVFVGLLSVAIVFSIPLKAQEPEDRSSNARSSYEVSPFFSLRPNAGSSLDSPSQEGSIQANPGEGVEVTPQKLGEALNLVRELFERKTDRGKIIYKYLNNHLEEELQINRELREKFSDPEKARFTESQLLYIMLMAESYWEKIRKFIEEIPRNFEDKEPEKIEVIKEKLSEFKMMFEAILNSGDIRAKFFGLVDPTKPLYLVDAEGKQGYEILRMAANHERLNEKGELTTPKDLLREAIRFVEETQKELFLNSYEFDLRELADALIEKNNELKETGSKKNPVTVGIDENYYQEDQKMKEVIDHMEREGVRIVYVDPVALNHQKIMVRDWSIKEHAAVLLSSANFTNSGKHPFGDFAERGYKHPEVRPNANHTIVLRSWILARTMQHRLLRLFSGDPEVVLRGVENIPFGAVATFKNPGKNQDPIKDHWTAISFTPYATNGDPNAEILGRLLDLYPEGKMGAVVFALSSKEFEKALAERVKRDIKTKGRIDLRLIGDTSFSVQWWSLLLRMSGWERIQLPGDQGWKYREVLKEPWAEVIPNRERLEELRNKIFRAPEVYGHHWVEDRSGEKVLITAKIHPKVIVIYVIENGEIVAGAATPGSSLNPSANSRSNIEQVFFTNDIKLVKFAKSSLDGLIELLKIKNPEGDRTVHDEVRRRVRENRPTQEEVIDKTGKIIRAIPKNQSSAGRCRGLFGAA